MPDYGRWTVVRETEPVIRVSGGMRHVVRRVEARCECGTTKLVFIGNLRSGLSVSCGCFKNEIHATRLTKHGERSAHRASAEYRAWQSMRHRCENPHYHAYRHYGGRGIKVCERWRKSFAAFLADVGRKSHPKLSLDRVNCDGHYEPSNVRWATAAEQARNRRKVAA